MSYPESNYDGADGSLEQDIGEADHKLKELNFKLGELEDELTIALEDCEDAADFELVVQIQDDIAETHSQITELKQFLGVTEF